LEIKDYIIVFVPYLSQSPIKKLGVCEMWHKDNEGNWYLAADDEIKSSPVAGYQIFWIKDEDGNWIPSSSNYNS
jgi:hypothetical protein